MHFRVPEKFNIKIDQYYLLTDPQEDFHEADHAARQDTNF